MESDHLVPRRRKSGCFKKYVADWIILAIAGSMALGFYLMPPIANRLFLVSNSAQDPINLEDGFPIRAEIIPMWMSGAISVVSGLFVIGIAQIWVKNCKDFHRGMLGLVTSLVASSWFQVICKILIGGLRPNFLQICQPDITKAHGQGYYGLYFDHSICTGDIKNVYDALESFPSGHSSAALAGLLYVSLYLNAKLKLWGDMYPRAWKLFVVFSPILAATVLSLTRLLDYTHHWYDILAGAVIGITFAFACYRMQYRSIFNPENNHMLLPRKPKKLTLTYSPPSMYDRYSAQGRAGP